MLTCWFQSLSPFLVANGQVKNHTLLYIHTPCMDGNRIYSLMCWQISSHCEAETKWPPFHRRYFQMHFLEWKILNFKRNVTEICSLGSNWKYGSIGLDNGLAPKRRQAIIWSNVCMFYWHIYATLFLNELTPCSASRSVGTVQNTRVDKVFSILAGWFWSVNPTERWCCNPTRASVWAWFSHHLKCWIHKPESISWWDF